LTSAGDRDAANEIRYLGRVRERETERGLAYIWSGAVQYIAGFGIGTYTFRVLYWVIGISLAGAVLLWMKVPAAKQHGPIWCFGASLARLLPVIEINKEFSAFFDDPKRERLTGWQSFIFSVIAMVGFCPRRDPDRRRLRPNPKLLTRVRDSSSSRVDSPAGPNTAHLTSRILIHLVARVRIDWDWLAHWRSTRNERENP
jgi:hypothetical protein